MWYRIQISAQAGAGRWDRKLQIVSTETSMHQLKDCHHTVVWGERKYPTHILSGLSIPFRVIQLLDWGRKGFNGQKLGRRPRKFADRRTIALSLTFKQDPRESFAARAKRYDDDRPH